MNTKTIAHFRNGMGNWVLFTPALRALAEMDESGQIDLCTDANWHDGQKESLLDIWEKTPWIQNVYTIADSFPKGYKTWFWTNWTTHGDALELFSAMKPYDADPWDHRKTHESDYYFNIVKKHYSFRGWKPTQYIPVSDGPILNEKKKKIVLCNGGFGYLIALKKYPHFKDVSEQLKKLYSDNIDIIKIGHKDELEGVPADIDYVNKLSVIETAKVIQQADLMITNDTGNMHIADSLGTPSIVLWGGSSVEKNTPYYCQCKVIHLGLNCQPCQNLGGYRDCPDIKCMGDISVGEVIFQVRTFLNEGRFK